MQGGFETVKMCANDKIIFTIDLDIAISMNKHVHGPENIKNMWNK